MENKHEYLMHKYLCDLPSNFQKQIKEYKRWQNQQQTLLGRLLLYKMLVSLEYNQISLFYNKNYKPILKDINLHFSISHSGSYVVCALSSNNIGVDIEKIQNRQIEHLIYFMSKNDWNSINNYRNKLLQFYDIWVKKEAIVKLLGENLLIFNKIDIFKDVATYEKELFFLKKFLIHDNYICYLASDSPFALNTKIEKHVSCINF
ncbi:MAG: 4'-phosphopantetheinyl transferase superfamily protein [Bacteroidales bacterium]|nr:4'-phosphopantetheinyl transferase superfamily protein [Bacteroidales bacterium]